MNGPNVVTRRALGDISNRGLGGAAKDGKAGALGKPGALGKAAASKQDERAAARQAAANLAASKPAYEVAGSALDSRLEKSDHADMSNAQAVAAYIADIHQHYRDSEDQKLASSNYMAAKQTDINHKMRAILVDWLIEVHLKFKLMPETLYLTVNLIDRYLEKETIMRNRLQLVGVTAMFIASKYEEIYAPECRDFVYISDKAYTRGEILQMEGSMLAKLNFQLTAPNTYVFFKRFVKIAGIGSGDTRAGSAPRTQTDFLANFLVELTLQEYKMLKYRPSMIAAAAVYLAQKTLGKEPWSAELERQSGYSEAAVLPCVREIHELHKNATANNLQAVRKKYAQEKHGAVSSIPPASLVR